MKKNMLTLLVLCLLPPLHGKAQDTRSNYLFKSYQPAVVYLGTGQYTRETINFNLLDNKLYFVDRKDNEKKIINGSIAIDSICVDNRTFLYDNEKGVREVINRNPTVCVQYKAVKKNKAAVAGYGGTSETSNVTSYSEFRSDGLQTMQDKEVEIADLEPIYWILIKEKEKEFIDIKDLSKIYSKEKDKLIKYNEDKKINFRSPAEVVALCKYMEEK